MNYRTIALAVSCQLLAVASMVEATSADEEFVAEKSSNRAGFLRVLRFTLPIIPPIAPH
jgi:hypothetical protein